MKENLVRFDQDQWEVPEQERDQRRHVQDVEPNVARDRENIRSRVERVIDRDRCARRRRGLEVVPRLVSPIEELSDEDDFHQQGQHDGNKLETEQLRSEPASLGDRIVHIGQHVVDSAQDKREQDLYERPHSKDDADILCRDKAVLNIDLHEDNHPPCKSEPVPAVENTSKDRQGSGSLVEGIGARVASAASLAWA